MRTELIFGELSGGGKVAASKNVVISANAHPSWNQTPFKANSILLVASFYLNGNIGSWHLTNTNPATGEIDNSACWESYDGGATWSKVNAGWTVQDTYIELLEGLGNTVFHCTFIITEKGSFEFEQ